MVFQTSKRPLTILHTNDFHNHLNANRLDKIAAVTASCAEPKLLLDAGDAVGSGNITFRPGGEPILDELSRAGYGAMTLGNREFHVSRIGFRTKVSRARFPVLCANIRPSRAVDGVSPGAERPLAASLARDEPDLRSYILRDFGDWRVLVFGLTVPMVTASMWERKLSSYIFDPPIKTAATIVPILRDRLQPDLTIALTHIGIRQDRELAERVPDIDLIIGGHTHEALPNGETVGGTLVVQAGSHGRFIGVVSVVGGETETERPRMSARIEPL